MISEMAAVEIVGPITLFTAAVETIQPAGVLHIVETPPADFNHSSLLRKIHLTDSQEREREACAQTVAAVNALAAEIPVHIAQSTARSKESVQHYARLLPQALDALSARTRFLNARVRSFIRRERNLTDDINSLGSYQKILSVFAPLVETSEMPKSHELVGVVFERRNKLARDMLQREMKRLAGDSFTFLEQPLEGGRIAVLLGFSRTHAARVRSFITQAGIGDMAFPRHLRDRPFVEALAALQEELATLTNERLRLRERMEGFFRDNAAESLALHRLLHDHLARYNALPKFACTQHAFVIQGWISLDDVEALRAALSRISDASIVVREVPGRGMGMAPVRLENNEPVRSFEPLLSLMPLPRYGTLDPTIYLATFFPPIFGLMLADVGYGAILLAAAGIMLAKGKGRKMLHSLGLIAGFCGVFSVIFGFVFGELFGELGKQMGLRPLWQERFTLEAGRSSTTLLGYLMIAVAVGAMQVVFGLVLGIINGRKSGDKGMALGSAAKIAGLAMLFFFVGRLAKVLPPIFISFGVVALIILLTLMVMTMIRHPSHVILIPIEILGAVGNILSYARIMAIGLSSVVLSIMASMLGGMAGNVALAVLIVVLVNALNLVLGIIDPTIQGLRLQYVEFFSKFYLGGGRPFAPFKKTGGVAS
jgi:V/A-type H+/Na+-transporting ATPase subunit I